MPFEIRLYSVLAFGSVGFPEVFRGALAHVFTSVDYIETIARTEERKRRKKKRKTFSVVRGALISHTETSPPVVSLLHVPRTPHAGTQRCGFSRESGKTRRARAASFTGCAYVRVLTNTYTEFIPATFHRTENLVLRRFQKLRFSVYTRRSPWPLVYTGSIDQRNHNPATFRRLPKQPGGAYVSVKLLAKCLCKIKSEI